MAFLPNVGPNSQYPTVAAGAARDSVLRLEPGVYTGAGNCDVERSGGLQITGHPSGSSIIDCSAFDVAAKGSALRVSSGACVLTNFTMRGCRGANGGAVNTRSGGGTYTGMTFTDNAALCGGPVTSDCGFGGAVAMSAGGGDFFDCEFRRNEAVQGASLSFIAGGGVISNTVFDNNQGRGEVRCLAAGVSFPGSNIGRCGGPAMTFRASTAPTAGLTAIATTAPLTVIPTADLTVIPTADPTAIATAGPTAIPTAGPTAIATADPTAIATAGPTAIPTAGPTAIATTAPLTAIATADPTVIPTADPTAIATPAPLTAIATAGPTVIPTAGPTAIATADPTAIATAGPTAIATTAPLTAIATAGPTSNVRGDPHFRGFGGGSFDVMGEPEHVYNIVSDVDFHMNALFVSGLTTHASTFIGNLGVQTAGHTILFTSMSCSVELDGEVLAHTPEAMHVDSSGEVLLSTTANTMSLHTPRYDLWLQCFPKRAAPHFNFNMAYLGGGEAALPHGILGQTADMRVREKHGHQGEGAIEGTYRDYEVSTLWSTDFVYNRYTGLTSQQLSDGDWHFASVE